MSKSEARSPIFPVLAVGIFLRLLLLVASIPHFSEYTHDELIYVTLAKELLKGQYSPQAIFPPGFPFSIALSLKLFGAIWPLALFNIALFAIFSLWIYKELSAAGYAKPALWVTWFLCLDPVWLCQTILVDADFQGAVFYGVALICLVLPMLTLKSQALTGSRVFLIGACFAAATLIKPVYVFIPILCVGLFFQGTLRRRLPVFLAGWLVICGPYIGYRWAHTHQIAISAHNSLVFTRYAVGSIFVTQGLATDLDGGMQLADRRYGVAPEVAATIPAGKYAAKMISENAFAFLRVLAVNCYKTVLGQSNMAFLRLLHGPGNDEGPGIWVQLTRNQGLFAKLRSVSWAWILSMLLVFVEKIGLIALALKGCWKMMESRFKLEGFTLLMMAAYFALTPFAFGDPRYFLPGTLCLLLLASSLTGVNPQSETAPENR